MKEMGAKRAIGLHQVCRALLAYAAAVVAALFVSWIAG